MAQPGARRPPPPVAQFSHQQQAHKQNAAAAAAVSSNDFQSRLNSHSLQNSPTSSLAVHPHSHPHHQASNSLTSTPYHHHHHGHHRTTTTTTSQNVGGGGHTKAADALALAAQAGRVKPGNYRGHQRRQSVARLLPDISKLRLLSWLVEASNELINCDIAIMDGVYAKLNRSRESLLFWQSQTSQASQTSSKRAPPPRPPPPSVMPVAGASNKAVISNHKQQRQPVKQQTPSLLGNNNNNNNSRSGRSKAPGSDHPSAGGPGSHHSLPLTNYDSSSLAALSMRSSKTIPSTSAAAVATTKSTQSAAANSIDAMMRQNLRHAAGQPSSGSAMLTPKPAARNNRSLPMGLLGSCDNAQQQRQTNVDSSFLRCDRPVDSDDDEEEEADDDDDDNSSSAASSTTSSGIHETSSSDSSCSADSSTSSSAGDSSCSFDEPSASIANNNKNSNSAANSHQAQQQQQPQQPQVSSAEQLSERIRRAVMEHNYLQNLLVNVIRQHDRQRELLERQRRHQMILMRQHGRSEPFGRSLGGGGSSAGGAQGQLVLPRIDLADIADALDDGCQCSCHSHGHSQSQSSSRHHSICGNSPAPSLLGGGGGGTIGSQRASTLPTSSSLSLSSSTATSATNQTTSGGGGGGGGRLLVPSRKNRRKKGGEPSREDIIQRLADKLCASCFETHYWLYSCHSAGSSALAADLLTPLQEQQVESAAAAGGAQSTSGGGGGSTAGDLKASTAGREQSLASSGGGGTTATSKEQQSNLDAAISLRNATFIKLVQQQVRSTISNSIELIDLIRKEIKSPESIKQKQLMRCFSASIQLLSSVAGYVVPSQDISTFIQADTGPVNGACTGVNHPRFFDQTRDQQAQLFNLPPSDFDHLLLQAALSSPTSAQYPYGSSSGSPNQMMQKSNYHLAQAPEIPIRRRYNTLLGQRRSSDETNSLPVTGHSGADAFRSLPPNACIGNTGANSFGAYDNSGKLRTVATSTNPNGDESSSGASSNNSSASSSIARNQVTQQQQHPSLTKAHTASAIMDGKTSHDFSFEAMANLSHHHQTDDDLSGLGSGSNRTKFWQSSKFNFIKKLLQVKQQRLLRQQSKDRRIYNNKVANKFRLVMMDLTHFNRSQQLLATENGVNSLLTSMRNVLEFGLYLTVKLY